MMRRLRLGPALLALLAACAGTPPPAPPANLATLTVSPVENRTGSPLVIAGDTYLEQWIGRDRRTVADGLAHEIATALRAQGFAVATGGDVPRFTIVLRRFEPDLPQLSYVSVTLTATVTDPDGTVRWSLERTGWPVSTTGAPSIASAYDTAVRQVARSVVDGWIPAR
jgi:ABC-type uncharacterized transport system auxiliary subunit